MVRSPASDDTSLKKGPWTPEEDDKLIKHIHKHGHRSWSALPKLADLNRCGKSCRLRWTNYLRPDIKRGRFSPEEEQTILNLHAVLGNKWSTIANHLPGRTDNEIKNFWNTHLKKKLIQMGFDPMTHRPRTDIFSTLSQLMSLTNLRELVDMQQQQVPIEDQALFNLQADMAKLQFFQSLLQPLPMNSNINPNDLHILNLLNSIKENSNNSNLDLNFLNSHLQDLNSLPSLKTLDSNHNQSAVFPQNPDENHLNQRDNLHSSQIWLPEPLTMPPSHDHYVVDNVGSNVASSSHQELAAAAAAWPDHLLDDSLFSNIAYDQS